MRIREFGVEIWMNAHENDATWNLAETCVDSITIGELLALAGRNDGALAELLPMRMGYGAIEGSERLKAAICGLYDWQAPQNVIVTHGTIGANHLVHSVLAGPGDVVVSIVPTYQQHVSIPESCGATVRPVWLKPENAFLPDLADLAEAAKGAKLIALTNPNNPTGALIDREGLEAIIAIARENGACKHKPTLRSVAVGCVLARTIPHAPATTQTRPRPETPGSRRRWASRAPAPRRLAAARQPANLACFPATRNPSVTHSAASLPPHHPPHEAGHERRPPPAPAERGTGSHRAAGRSAARARHHRARCQGAFRREAGMSGASLLLHLAGAASLMLYATRLVKAGVERACGDMLRHRMRATTCRAVRVPSARPA